VHSLRVIGSAAILLAASVSIVSCSSAGATPRAVPSASPTDVSITTAEDLRYLPTAAQEPQCHEPPVSTRIAAATDPTQTVMGEGVLATPEETAAQGPEAMERQREAWKSLTPDDLIFQLCFREEQEEGAHGDPSASPTP
jgi:hypothetical protein